MKIRKIMVCRGFLNINIMGRGGLEAYVELNKKNIVKAVLKTDLLVGGVY